MSSLLRVRMIGQDHDAPDENPKGLENRTAQGCDEVGPELTILQIVKKTRLRNAGGRVRNPALLHQSMNKGYRYSGLHAGIRSSSCPPESVTAT